MKISPILLLSIGSTFAFLYGLIITVGWAITRKNRKKFHLSVGLNEIELYDLRSGKPLNKYTKAFSLTNNYFKDDRGETINPKNFNCYIIENESSVFPKIKKGYLVFMNRDTKNIEYAFNIPNLLNYR